MAHDVFISYSSQDKSVADAVCATLESRKIRCWIVPRDVLAGQPYAESILDGINSSRVFVLVFSSDSNLSQQVLREVERAVSKGIPILPFRIEDVAPTKSMELFLSATHWLDALTPPLEKHLSELADTLEILLGTKIPKKTEAPPPDKKAEKVERKSIIKPAYIIGGIVVVAIIILLIFLARGGGDKGKTNGLTSNITSTTSAITGTVTPAKTTATTSPVKTTTPSPTTMSSKTMSPSATTTPAPIVTGSGPGTINIITGQDGSKIYVDKEYYGITSWPAYAVTANGLPSGTFSLKIVTPNFKDWSKQITIGADQTTKIYAYPEPGPGSAVTRDETISYASAFSILNVITGQDASKIYINDEYGGVTTWPSYAVTVNGLLPGTYTLKIITPALKDWVKQITLTADQTTRVYAYPEPGSGIAVTRNETISYASSVGTLNVITGQDASKIYINNEYGGVTTWPSYAVTTNGLFPGTYSLRIITPGFKDWVKQITITADQTTKIYAYPEPGSGPAVTRNETISYASAFGILNVITGQDASKIYINDEYGGVTTWPSYAVTVNGLLPGTYTLRIITPGFKDWIKQVIITADQTNKVNAYPEPL